MTIEKFQTEAEARQRFQELQAQGIRCFLDPTLLVVGYKP